MQPNELTREQRGCADCKLSYADPGFQDLIVSQSEWEKISPRPGGDGLLCPTCICRRLTNAGIEASAIFKSGPFARAGEERINRISEMEAELAEAKSAFGKWMNRAHTFDMERQQLSAAKDSAVALAAMWGDSAHKLAQVLAAIYPADVTNVAPENQGEFEAVHTLLAATENALKSSDLDKWLAERYVSKEDADRINGQLVWAGNFLRGIGFAEEWMAAIPIKVSADQQGTAWLAERDKRMRAEGATEAKEQAANRLEQIKKEAGLL